MPLTLSYSHGGKTLDKVPFKGHDVHLMLIVVVHALYIRVVEVTLFNEK